MSQLDYFAIHASDADVEAYRSKVPNTTRREDNGMITQNAERDDWRALARYMFAQDMLARKAVFDNA